MQPLIYLLDKRLPHTQALLGEEKESLVRPDQINCLFHGSDESIFLAFEKKLMG